MFNWLPSGSEQFRIRKPLIDHCDGCTTTNLEKQRFCVKICIVGTFSKDFLMRSVHFLTGELLLNMNTVGASSDPDPGVFVEVWRLTVQLNT
jgi:hypothetical protein